MPTQDNLTWANSRALVWELLSKLGQENENLRIRQRTAETDMARMAEIVSTLREQCNNLKAKYDKIVALCWSILAVVIAGLVLTFARKVLE